MSKIYYSIEQAARKLGISVRQVEALVSSEHLPVQHVGNRQVIPAKAVDSLGEEQFQSHGQPDPPKTTRMQRANHNRQYYTDVEVAKVLKTPYTEIYRMANLGQLPVTFVDDRRVFPKQAIDHLATQKMPTEKTATRSRSKGAIGAKKQKPNRPTRGVESGAASSSQTRSIDENYFTLRQVAYALNRGQEYVESMVRRGEIKATRIGGKTWISAEEMQRIISKREPFRQTRIKNRLGKPQRVVLDETDKLTAGSQTSVRSARPNKQNRNANAPQAQRAARNLQTGTTSSVHTVQEYKGRIEELEKALDVETRRNAQLRKEMQDEHALGGRVHQEIDPLKELFHQLRLELSEEREKNATLQRAVEKGHRQDQSNVHRSNYEMDWLNAELENLRRDSEATHSELEHERSRRIESERKTQELQLLLAAKVEEIRSLQVESSLLAEIRERLTGTNSRPLQQADTASSYTDTLTTQDQDGVKALDFHTEHGKWTFRPPFELEIEEIELIRLVVGQYGITADQIRRQKGRRSVEKLNDLLDRLHEQELEPITEDDDFYSFNPDSLND